MRVATERQRLGVGGAERKRAGNRAGRGGVATVCGGGVAVVQVRGGIVQRRPSALATVRGEVRGEEEPMELDARPGGRRDA